MHIPITPLTILAALLTGALGAYLAHRRGRNPYIWFCIGSFFGILVRLRSSSPQKKNSPKAKPGSPKEERPLQTIQGPSDKFWYYLNPEHQQVGTHELRQLEQRLATRKDFSYYVCMERRAS